jgi:site-specific recombinase XerD
MEKSEPEATYGRRRCVIETVLGVARVPLPGHKRHSDLFDHARVCHRLLVEARAEDLDRPISACVSHDKPHAAPPSDRVFSAPVPSGKVPSTQTALLPLIDGFVRAIRSERGYSCRTALTYQCSTRRLAAFLANQAGAEASTADLTAARLRQFVVYLAEERGHRPKSIRTAMNGVRAFARYLVREGHLLSDPTEKVELPKLTAPSRPVADDAWVCQLLDACEAMPERKRTLARVIIAVLAYSGIRRRELLDLKLADISFERSSIMVTKGKGGKARTVYVCSECLEHLNRWLGVRGACAHDWLFAHDARDRIGYDRIGALIHEAAELAGLPGTITPHQFRRAWASRLVRKGASLEAVRDGMGHASIVTTSAYVHGDTESMRKLASLGAIEPTGGDSASNEGASPRIARPKPHAAGRHGVSRATGSHISARRSAQRKSTRRREHEGKAK